MTAQLTMPVLPVADPKWARDRLMELEQERRLTKRSETDALLLRLLDELDATENSTRTLAAESGMTFRDTSVVLASMERRGLIFSARGPARDYPDTYVEYETHAHVVAWWAVRI